jgi:hypothetical protein
MLGGLMRGTTGAFLRGALGTATQAIQQVNLDDQEEIKTGVEKFGSKYETYKEGLGEYNAERKNIKNVAAALSAQDDAFIKGLDAGELEGVAQSLITISGAGNDASKAIEFFLNNRDKLKAVAAPQAPSVTAADAQTNAAMAAGITPTPQPEDRSFLQKLFKGQTDDEIADKIAKKAGVTREQYNAVMSGTGMPQVGDPSMLLSIGKEDPYKKLIMDNNSNVLAAIKSDQPIYSTPEGRALAEGYLQSLAAYGAGGEGAPTSEAMLDMQSKILTAAAPPDAKTFFEAFDTTLTTLNTRLNGKDSKLPQAIRDKAMPLFQDILRMKQQAQIPGSDFASNPDNATVYADKVFALTDVLNVTQTDDTFKTVTTMFDEMMKDAIAKPNRYGADNLELLFATEEQLREGQKTGDTTILNAARNTFTDILSSLPEPEDDMTDYQRTRENVINFLMSEQGGGLSREAAELAATEQIDLNKIVMDQQTPSIIVTMNGQRVLKPLPRISAKTGIIGAPGPKIESLNLEKINKNSTSVNAIGETIIGLEVEPDAFNFFGDVMLKTSDALDIVRLGGAFPGIGKSAVNIQRMRQNTIPLIATAKDRLFEDPRLSDQDLAIVLNYVAVINDSTIGATRAMAALINLQEALAQDNAMRMYQNNPSTKIVSRVDGNIDFSDTTTIAGQTMKSLAESQGFKVLTQAEADALTDAQYDKYEKQFERVAAMTARTIQRVEALRDLGGDTKMYRETYRGQSNLINVGSVSDTPEYFDTNVKVGTLAVELAAGRERVLAKDPSFYGDS